MTISTLDIVRHDACSRLQTWSSQYILPRIPLSDALNTSLRSGLLVGDPGKAYAAFMAQASTPGLDIEGRNVYDIAQHHACLVEVICAYLLGNDGLWKPCGEVDGFQPMSFLMADGRLRRIVLCSNWNALRESEERHSWWTVADTAVTERPMLINAIVIGQSRNGFRLSPWTTGFIHPENSIMRIKKKEGKFTDNWKRVYRETTDNKTAEWLRLMQLDSAFEDIVQSVHVDVPAMRVQILEDIERIAEEILEERTTMRRSNCFRYGSCPMIRVCHHPQPMTPENSGWERRLPVLA